MQKSEMFQANLLKVMKEKGISPSELARMMGTSPSTVSRWTAGALPHARTLDKLEKTLRTTLKPEEEVPEITKDPAEAGALRAMDLGKLVQAVPNANTGILLGAVWTGVGDVLAWRLPFDNQITDKLQVIITELARRAPAAIGYTRPIEPTPKPAKP